MGFKLYREVRDRAPSDWTPPERLVAWVIADDANDDTRKSWIKLPELMERTGIKSKSGVRQALQRLASRGYEFRVPIGEGKDGRLVFAAKGHSLDYIVPPMPERRLHTVAFIGDSRQSPNGKGDAGESPLPPKGDSTQSPNGPKATVSDAIGDSSQSPLSSAPLLTDQKMASRRVRASGADATLTDHDKIEGTRFAIAAAYGQPSNETVSDEDVLALFELKAPRNGKVGNVINYMTKIFDDTPGLDTLLAQLDDDGGDDWDLAAETAKDARPGGTATLTDGWNRAVLNSIKTALFVVTGKAVDDQWAARVAGHILDGKGVRNPVQYVTSVISNDSDPRRFLPTPTP